MPKDDFSKIAGSKGFNRVLQNVPIAPTATWKIGDTSTCESRGGPMSNATNETRAERLAVLGELLSANGLQPYAEDVAALLEENERLREWAQKAAEALRPFAGTAPSS